MDSNDLKLTQYDVFSQLMSNIAALTPFEYKEKLQNLTDDFLSKHNKDFQEFFKNAKRVELSEETAKKVVDRFQVRFSGYTNYQELIEEAKILNKFFAKPAYNREFGRLHRSMARIAILLTLTAAEDYVNLKGSSDKGFTKKNIREKSLLHKWKLLIPDIETKFPFFKEVITLRNEKIVHFKEHEEPSLEYITDLNFKNAENAIETVEGMIMEYERASKINYNPLSANSFGASLLTIAEDCSRLMKKFKEEQESNTKE